MDPRGPHLFGTFSYGITNRKWNYQLGGATAWEENSNRWNLSTAFQLYQLTTIKDIDLLPNHNEQAWRALWGTDVNDYYLRRGTAVSLQWQSALELRPHRYPQRSMPNMFLQRYPTTADHSLRLTLLLETHEYLQKTLDFNFSHWTPYKMFVRPNAQITAGNLHSLILAYNFDTLKETDEEDIALSGWYHTVLVEHATPEIGSDFDFTRIQLHLRRYQPVGKNYINTRLKIGLSTDNLPLQRQFLLGGIGTLRGYPLYEFSGSQGVLFNVEYFYKIADLFIITFADMGQVWNSLGDMQSFSPKINVGVGIQSGPFRFNIAKPLEADRGNQFNLRWSHMF